MSRREGGRSEESPPAVVGALLCLIILLIGVDTAAGAMQEINPVGWRLRAAGSSPAQATPGQPAGETQAPPKRRNVAVSPPALDRAINEVIQQRKYTWRSPREKLEGPEPQKGVLGRFLDRVADMVSRWVKGIGDWLDRLLRRLLSGRRQRAPTSSGYGWIMTLELLMYLLVIAVVVALVLLLYRVLRERQLRALPINTEPIQPVPDLADENLGADQLPEDGWTKLARELLERGDLRLALRAYYFASLAHLAARNLISLAKFKSNRDYERELVRRGHSFPGLLASFGENVSVFDRIWYGLHEINRDLVSQFAANVERIKNPA